MAENLSQMHFSNFGMFSVVGGYRILAGLAGGAGRGGVEGETGSRLPLWREWT